MSLLHELSGLIARKPKESVFEGLSKAVKGREPGNVAYDLKQLVESLSWVLRAKSKVIFGLRYLRNQVMWKAILSTAKKENRAYLPSLADELCRLYYAYWIAGHNAAKVRDISFQIIEHVKNSTEIDAVTEIARDKLQKDRIAERAMESLDTDVFDSPWLKRVLLLIEYGLTDDSKLAFVDLDKDVHVNHILPRGWENDKYWKGLWTKEEASVWLNKIGNLTLVSGRKNEAAQNRSFEKKKAIYRGERGDGATGFSMSRELCRLQDWTPEGAEKRQKLMRRRISEFLRLDV